MNLYQSYFRISFIVAVFKLEINRDIVGWGCLLIVFLKEFLLLIKIKIISILSSYLDYIGAKQKLLLKNLEIINMTLISLLRPIALKALILLHPYLYPRSWP